MNIPMNQRPTNSLHTITVNDEMGNSIMTAIDHLSADASLFTRHRLQGVRSREAIKLAQTAMVEAMAAKGRVFGVAVRMAEDHACQLLLADSMAKTKAVNRENADTIAEAAVNFERMITDREQVAYMVEFERIADATEQLNQRKISQHRYDRLVASIEESTDKIVTSVHETTRELLQNLRRRFNTAQQQAGM